MRIASWAQFFIFTPKYGYANMYKVKIAKRFFLCYNIWEKMHDYKIGVWVYDGN